MLASVTKTANDASKRVLKLSSWSRGIDPEDSPLSSSAAAATEAANSSSGKRISSINGPFSFSGSGLGSSISTGSISGSSGGDEDTNGSGGCGLVWELQNSHAKAVVSMAVETTSSPRSEVSEYGTCPASFMAS